jgi:hypothetical protein
MPIDDNTGMIDQLVDTFAGATGEGQALVRKTEADLSTFVALLDSIDTLDERLKLLWKQIYENALMDRRNAYVVWMDLYMTVHGNPEQHVIHGDHLSKYMERMEKANTQLLKLAELVYKAKDKQEAEEVPRGGALFDRLEKKLR